MNQNDEPPPAPVPRAIGAPQAGEARDRWWWVERGVWTERMLTRLTANESADRVWFRLWDKTYAPANLQSAFHQVWRKGGSAGADQQTVAHFARQAEAELARLHEQLRAGTYRPQPVPSPAARNHDRWAYRRCATARCKPRCDTYWSRFSKRSLPSTATASVPDAGPRTRCGGWTPC